MREERGRNPPALFAFSLDQNKSHYAAKPHSTAVYSPQQAMITNLPSAMPPPPDAKEPPPKNAKPALVATHPCHPRNRMPNKVAIVVTNPAPTTKPMQPPITALRRLKCIVVFSSERVSYLKLACFVKSVAVSSLR